ncbi:hypothetical protein DXX93_11895 [Thalassotalea euphylliae]|uniref:Dienelactone hydrolase domain-containing protein n=1 Tax=Thalassotalea euphylliae TaxID=1655234 RepID=A0A3E0TRJ8_9GAMM|nr:hypothetical protein [Thalassotalea euphylliae]REL27199.1 hypothetical protein DXX93_11895 [Thalassotalea euphylliae]
MTILLVSDIFGRTPAFEALAKSLDDIAGSPTILFDPYQGENLNFADEQVAYQYFSQHIGVETYANMLAEFLAFLPNKSPQTPLIILGFSVGASAAWLLACNDTKSECSSNVSLPQVAQVIGLYGGQIRKYADLRPSVATTLIFPESEAHFDVTALTQKLATITNVKSSQVPYLHGYLNQHSENFNQAGYDSFLTNVKYLIG